MNTSYHSSPILLQEQEQALRLAWLKYQTCPNYEHFVTFSSLLNHFTDSLQEKSQAGLLYVCRQLEQKALALFGNETSHPISDADMEDTGKKVVRLCELMRYYAQQGFRQQRDRRSITYLLESKLLISSKIGIAEADAEAVVYGEDEGTDGSKDGDMVEVGVRNRKICLLGGREETWRDLVAQLSYFGIKAQRRDWQIPTEDDADLGIYLVDMTGKPEHFGFLKILRERRPMALIACMNVADDFAFIHQALIAGVDRCFLEGEGTLQRVLELVIDQMGTQEESYRVLVVEDSKTAAQSIRRSLESHGVEVYTLNTPSHVLQVIRNFQPDLILMDMYMPYCTGVEALRVIRQHDEFLSIPVVYLSGETDVGLQVAALRLGGDQFLTKPHNPVLMNAVVKSKIERYRALRRMMQNDSLTGLLNHTSSKKALADALKNMPEEYCLDVVMLDIDHFKQINDAHGHAVGDQVIRSLAWLLKQRLRQGDIVGRYGGEEFVLGLVGRIPGGALESLDHIREDFNRISFNGANGASFTVSFSAGLVSQEKTNERWLENVLERADNALYQAKSQGRNRIVMAGRIG
ncbi:MAG: diguanylate cyclase [Betaproteobacteria bacterium]|nr:diguanylate cyclase [Betaproteobacteria bacterium]